jgi:hypothetical protein
MISRGLRERGTSRRTTKLLPLTLGLYTASVLRILRRAYPARKVDISRRVES